MSWTLSKAAHAFANRLSRRHGAQEEPDGGSGSLQPSIYKMCQGEEEPAPRKKMGAAKCAAAWGRVMTAHQVPGEA